jgi:hypothetical protein
MATIKGSVSQRASYDSFYIDYDVVADYTRWEWNITARAMLKVGWSFNASGEQDTLTVAIAGMRYIKTQPWAYGHGTWNMGAHNVKIPFKSGYQTIGISANTTHINAAGHGPGNCNAAGSVVLPARYYAKGTLRATAAREDKISVSFTDFDINVPYDRTVKLYYKKSSASSSKVFKTFSLRANSNYHSLSASLGGLSPGTGYTIIVEVYCTPANKMFYSTRTSAVTAATTLTMDIAEVGDNYCNVEVAASKHSVYSRSAVLYYAKPAVGSNNPEWVRFSSHVIPKGSEVTKLTHMISGLLPNQSYLVQARLYQREGTVEKLLKTVTSSSFTTKNKAVLPSVQIASHEQNPLDTAVKLKFSVSSILDGAIYTLEIFHESEWKDTKEFSGLGVNDFNHEGGQFYAPDEISGSHRFRVKVTHPDVENPKYSPEKIIYVEASMFDWLTPKVKGRPAVISAKEWNRMILWAAYTVYDVDTESFNDWPKLPEEVNKGDVVSHNDFNKVLTRLKLLGSVGEKHQGYPILASDFELIKQKINTRILE